MWFHFTYTSGDLNISNKYKNFWYIMDDFSFIWIFFLSVPCFDNQVFLEFKIIYVFLNFDGWNFPEIWQKIIEAVFLLAKKVSRKKQDMGIAWVCYHSRSLYIPGSGSIRSNNKICNHSIKKNLVPIFISFMWYWLFASEKFHLYQIKFPIKNSIYSDNYEVQNFNFFSNLNSYW